MVVSVNLLKDAEVEILRVIKKKDSNLCTGQLRDV